jgi:hypothetical protein
LSFVYSPAQTLGGNAVYNFLKLPSTPLLTASGGANTSFKTNEVGLAANNPALLDADLHKQLNLTFNGMPAGIKTYSATGAFHSGSYGTTFGGQIYFVDYGNIPQTDASGVENGSFRPVDFVVQVSAARKYLEKWSYGASLKFIHSAYGQYRSSGLAIDVGLHFEDTANLFYAGLIAKNMGVQLTSFAGEREDLPFELQVGVTKKLAQAPFAFSFTAQHLQHFNILYEDSVFNNENDLGSNDNFANRLLNHFVVATHISIGDHLEATLGYNHLRRSELNIGSTGNGLNGFSMGLRLIFQKLQVMYARSNYQRNISYNQLGLSLRLDRMFGLGSNL